MGTQDLHGTLKLLKKKKITYTLYDLYITIGAGHTIWPNIDQKLICNENYKN